MAAAVPPLTDRDALRLMQQHRYSRHWGVCRHWIASPGSPTIGSPA